MIPEDYHTQFYWSSKSARGRHRFLTDEQRTSSVSREYRRASACAGSKGWKKLNPINRTSEEFLTLHTECTLGQRAKGQRGIHPRPGRPYLNKPGMPDGERRRRRRRKRWRRGRGRSRRERTKGRNHSAINMSNKYQHFWNDLLADFMSLKCLMSFPQFNWGWMSVRRSKNPQMCCRYDNVGPQSNPLKKRFHFYLMWDWLCRTESHIFCICCAVLSEYFIRISTNLRHTFGRFSNLKNLKSVCLGFEHKINTVRLL